MTDLLAVVPDFDTQDFSHIIPPLERASISTADLLSLDALVIAKRAHVPPDAVKRLVDALIQDLGRGGSSIFPVVSGDNLTEHHCLSLLDDRIDAALNGGVHTGYLTEFAGESAAGKTQCLLTLLLSVQICPTIRERKNALYISTEAQLSTPRLTQILKTHPQLTALPKHEQPSLNRIQSTQIRDLESQEHVLYYQVPVIIQRHNIGLLVIDSIAANYRAEFDKSGSRRGADSFAKRSLQVSRLATHLRQLARTHNIAVVVANQVADRFDSFGTGMNQLTQRSIAASPSRNGNVDVVSHQHQPESAAVLLPSVDDPMSLDHQQRFFSGWGDEPVLGSFKTPSLGLTWTNQLATRIVLTKSPVYENAATPGEEKILTGWDRLIKVVFSSWCASNVRPFEIWQGGLRGIVQEEQLQTVKDAAQI